MRVLVAIAMSIGFILAGTGAAFAGTCRSFVTTETTTVVGQTLTPIPCPSPAAGTDAKPTFACRPCPRNFSRTSSSARAPMCFWQYTPDIEQNVSTDIVRGHHRGSDCAPRHHAQPTPPVKLVAPTPPPGSIVVPSPAPRPTGLPWFPRGSPRQTHTTPPQPLHVPQLPPSTKTTLPARLTRPTQRPVPAVPPTQNVDPPVPVPAPAPENNPPAPPPPEPPQPPPQPEPRPNPPGPPAQR